MRVALVCPYSISVFGGVQTQVMGLSDAFRSLGHEVDVVAPADGPTDVEGLRAVGNSIKVRANGSVAPISPLPPAWRRTLRAVRVADVIHVHEPFVPGPALACLLQKQVPVVGTFHQSGFGWPYAVASPIFRWLGRRIAVPVAVSEAAAAMVRRPLGRPVEVLWNGVSTPGPVEPIETLRPTISFLGRHEERKGLGVLLGALSKLELDVQVWVMGEGPLTAQLRDRFANDRRIEWLGKVDDVERDRRLAASDIYCAPNLGGESFGVVLLEAMRFGTPVVASDIEAFRAVARPERFEGQLFPPGDEAALADALRSLLGDHTKRRRIGAAGARRAAELSMEQLALRYDEIFNRVVRAVA